MILMRSASLFLLILNVTEDWMGENAGSELIS